MMTDLTNTTPLAFFTNWRDILIVLVVVFILFGGKKLPELARGLAKGMRIFRDELKGVQEELENPAPPKEVAKPQLPPKDQTVASQDAKQQEHQEQKS